MEQGGFDRGEGEGARRRADRGQFASSANALQRRRGESKLSPSLAHTLLKRPPRRLSLVAERAGADGWAVAGIAVAGADPYMLSDGPLFVIVQVIAVELEALSPLGQARVFLALLAALRLWAKAPRARRKLVHVTTGYRIEATDRLMKAAGARGIGGNYAV